jgi:hypothetical protein
MTVAYPVNATPYSPRPQGSFHFIRKSPPVRIIVRDDNIFEWSQPCLNLIGIPDYKPIEASGLRIRGNIQEFE